MFKIVFASSIYIFSYTIADTVSETLGDNRKMNTFLYIRDNIPIKVFWRLMIENKNV